MQNSKRNGKDGIVIFGYERKKDNSEYNSNIIYETNDEIKNKDFLFNDFIFPIETNEENNGLYESPNFAIYYNTEDNNYYIKDFNTGVGALMKIKKYAMEGNTLLNREK